ncbi:hypothetical protein QYM36_006193 [Artemia franciscana]|uniref:Uncharacterized protein n=1 Tax=Artemia franciscana TaxID=6661 RepID=A0AA88HZV9_ARTSF|nr:hypothetical protein QYM36_006193 [Artemia franciscana]
MAKKELTKSIPVEEAIHAIQLQLLAMQAALRRTNRDIQVELHTIQASFRRPNPKNQEEESIDLNEIVVVRSQDTQESRRILTEDPPTVIDGNTPDTSWFRYLVGIVRAMRPKDCKCINLEVCTGSSNWVAGAICFFVLAV